MKRSSDLTPSSSKRQTRSVSRVIQNEKKNQEAEERRWKEGKTRAERLGATDLLRALPLVFKSGFLYKFEVLSSISISKDWKDVWDDVKEELPVECEVKVSVDLSTKTHDWPLWAKMRGLDTVVPTIEFARQVFDKVMDLKVAAKPSERQRRKARDALPKWGVDFHGIRFMVWEPNTHNRGGVALSIYRCQSMDHSLFSLRNQIPNFLIRLDINMRLWTGIRCWRVYNGSPLWDWEFVDDSDSDLAL